MYVSYLRVLVLFFLVALRALLVSMSFLFLPFLSVPVAYLDYCIPCYVKGSVLFVYLFVALFLSVLLQCVWPCFPSFFLVFQTLLFGISIFHWILFVVRMVWLYSFRALLFLRYILVFPVLFRYPPPGRFHWCLLEVVVLVICLLFPGDSCSIVIFFISPHPFFSRVLIPHPLMCVCILFHAPSYFACLFSFSMCDNTQSCML